MAIIFFYDLLQIPLTILHFIRTSISKIRERNTWSGIITDFLSKLLQATFFFYCLAVLFGAPLQLGWDTMLFAGVMACWASAFCTLSNSASWSDFFTASKP
jgi:hypothetical protein